MSRLIWVESAIAFSRAGTMSRKLTSGGYQRSLANLAIALKRADHTILFDNSTEEGYRLVAILGPAGNQWLNPRPDWASAVA